MATKTITFSDFDLSFSNHPITGDLVKKTDVDAIKQSVKILMLSNFYERPFQPYLGGNIRAQLFELTSNLFPASIKNDITDFLETYEPRIFVNDVIAETSDANDLNISIFFTVKNKADQETIQLTFSR